MKSHVKTGNIVEVLVGKDKGKKGKILQVFPRMQRVAVEGINILKRHLRTRKRGDNGQIVEFPMPIHISNVKLVVENEGQTLSK